MKFPSSVSMLDLSSFLQQFEGRTYVAASEIVGSLGQKQVTGLMLHRAGYYKLLLKYAGKPHRVWCIDKSVDRPDNDKARSELRAHGVI